MITVVFQSVKCICNFQFLAFPCGMIRGALANLGVNSVVTAEVSAMPACKYMYLL